MHPKSKPIEIEDDDEDDEKKCHEQEAKKLNAEKNIAI